MALVLLATLAFATVIFMLDSIVKTGVEKIGTKVTQVEVKLDGARISAFSGQGTLNGLFVGNPAGYQSPSAIKVGALSMALQPSSVFSDKVVIRSIIVTAPEISFEGSLTGNNLSKLLAGIQSSSDAEKSGTPPGQKPPGKKLQVDELTVSGGKINVTLTGLGARSATVPLPEIHLQNLGAGPDGITPAELTQAVFKQVMAGTLKAVASEVTGLGRGVADSAKEAGRNASGAVEKTTKSISDLFKKK